MNKISKFAAIVLVIFLAGCAVPVIVYEITSEVQEGKRIDKENKRTNTDTKELKFKWLIWWKINVSSGPHEFAVNIIYNPQFWKVKMQKKIFHARFCFKKEMESAWLHIW